MGLFETIADRRIREARANGLFDNLPGRGRPIADLHLERKPGWWAARTVKAERDKLAHECLVDELAATRPTLWRLGTEAEVVDAVESMNRKIAGYNSTTSFVSIPELVVADIVATWRGLGLGLSGDQP